MRTSRFKKAISALLVLACMLAFLGAANFALELYGSKSDVVWDYFEKADHMDTIFIGTSVAGRAFNPVLIDEEYGSESENMATPMQTLEESYLGIQSAYEKFGISRVVMSLDFTDLQINSTVNLGSPFLMNRARVMGLVEDLRGVEWLISQKGAAALPSSINRAFPWVSDHPTWKDGIKSIEANMRCKLDGVDVVEAAKASDSAWSYIGKGYGNVSLSLDYDNFDTGLYLSLVDEKDLQFKDQSIDTLESIISYCKEHDIDLVVVNVPIPVFNIMGYSDLYIENQTAVADILASNDIEYYDFNYIKPEYLDIPPESFADNQHLNASGADLFSSFFVSFLERRDAGENLSELFYTPEEYLHTLDYVDMVDLSVLVGEGCMDIEGIAYAGPDVEIEYEVLVKPPRSDEWLVVQEYASNSRVRYQTSEHGSYQVRVNARKIGSSVEYDHYKTSNVVF